MADHPAPPLDITLNRVVQRAGRADPTLLARANMLLLRAARRLRARLEEGGGPLTLASVPDDLTLSVLLTPPDGCQVESLSEGADADGEALLV